MPRRALTPEEQAFVKDVAAFLKKNRSDKISEGLSDGQRFFWQVIKDLESPKSRAILDQQTGEILLKIARGEPIDPEPPAIPSKKEGKIRSFFRRLYELAS